MVTLENLRLIPILHGGAWLGKQEVFQVSALIKCLGQNGHVWAGTLETCVGTGLEESLWQGGR